LKKLTDEDLDKISEIAVSSAQNFIFSKVSKKEIIDIDIDVELNYNDGLDVDVTVDIIFDDLSSTDPKIADEAADYAIEEIEKFLSKL
jgi:K+-transporting ATPase c subunit